MIDTSNAKYYQRIGLWKDVSPADWNSRAWQLKNVVHDVETLSKVITISATQKEQIEKAVTHSRFMVTPYYLSLVDDKNPECPIRLQTIPQLQELEEGLGDLLDPLSEDADSPVPRLVHRYPDRTLFLVAETCSMYCRFCTRRRHILDKTTTQLSLLFLTQI